MKYEQEHLIIKSNSTDEITLEVDDYELFDFIEDYLIEECSIEYEYMSRSNDNKKHIMYFLNRYPFKKLKLAIKALDKIEIERIFKLNN